MIDTCTCCGAQTLLAWYDNRLLCTGCIDYAKHSTKPYEIQQPPPMKWPPDA